MARTPLPPGFRFHPTDIELIMYYLKRKLMGKKLHFEAISELNIYKFSPWDLPDKSCLKSKDLNWYFFCPRERKYSTGDRMRRGTETGYWKTTGQDRSIVYKERRVGMVKTLVFHEGCPPNGKRTDWVVYEYRMDDKNLADAGVAQDSYVLYKVFKKNGPGPKNGAQYGAPFNEEEWDEDDSGTPLDSLPSNGPLPPMLTVPENANPVASKSLIDPVCASVLPSGEAGPSLVQPSSNEVHPDGLSNSMVTYMFEPQSTSGWASTEQGLTSAGTSANDIPQSPDDEIAHLLAPFIEDDTFSLNEENYELDQHGHGRDNVSVPHLAGNDPFNGLEDLSTWGELNGGVNFSGGLDHNVLSQDDMAFLELNDLNPPLNFSVDSGVFEKIPTGSSYAACNPDASEHILTGMSSTPYRNGAYLGEICYNVNFPNSQTVSPQLNEFMLWPNSPGGQFGSTNVFTMENTDGNILSHGYTAGYNSQTSSQTHPEEPSDAAGNQERAGKPQREFFSRLQHLLASSVTEHLVPNFAYGDSSIHVNAEVTRILSARTKDALSVMLGESTYDYSCWWNRHGAEFWRKEADCSSTGSVVFYFGLKLVFMHITVFSLSFSPCLPFVELHFLFQNDCLL